MLTTVPTLKIVLVERIGISTSEIAIQVPSGHRIGVVVDVDVLIVRIDKRVEVVVIVVSIGLVATGADAAFMIATKIESSRTHGKLVKAITVITVNGMVRIDR